MVAKKNERGIALLLVLLALVLVSAVALGMMFMSDVETTVSSNFRDQQAAFFAGKAGLEELRDRMRSTSPAPITSPTAVPGSAAGVLYITANSNIDPTNSGSGNIYVDNEICNEIGCSGLPTASGWATTTLSSASYQPLSGAQLPYSWVRVNLKIDRAAGSTGNPFYVDGNSANANNYVCWNGTNEVVSSTACPGAPFPVYVVTALAITPSGSRRMVQYELTRSRVQVPPMPSALILDGSNVTFGTPHSQNFGINGQDAGTCDPSHALNPSVANITASGKDVVDTNMFRPQNLQGSDGGTPPSPTTGTVTDQVLPSSQLNGLQTVGDLNNLVQNVTNAADNVIDPSNPPNPMPNLNNAITVVNGDTSICSGSGILLVTGTLTCSGNNSWDGIILVIGRGIFQGNGGGNGAFTGAVLVASTLDAQGNPLPSSATPPAASFSFNGGGGNGITYNSCSIQRAVYGGGLPYQQLAFREIMR